jgi:hypothetical protein
VQQDRWEDSTRFTKPSEGKVVLSTFDSGN